MHSIAFVSQEARSTSMEWVAVVALGLVAVVTVVLGLLTIHQRGRDPVAWSFAVIMFASAGWAGGIATFYAADTSLALVDFAIRSYYISAALIALAIFYLAIFMTRHMHPIRRGIYSLLTLPFVAITLSFIIAQYVFIESVHIGSVVLSLPGYMVYTVYFLVYYGSALIFLALGARRARGTERLRLRYLVTGYSVAGFIGMAFNLILPAFGNYQYIWVGPLGLFIFVPMVYVTIVKYGLFDIRQAVARTMAYASTLILITAGYALVVTLLSSVVSTNVIAQTIIILVAALSFQPLKHFFDNLTDTIFYKNTYHTGEFYTQFNQRLTSTTDLRTLLKRTADHVKKNLKAQQAFLFVYTGDTQYVTAGSDGYKKMPYADALALNELDDELIMVDSPQVPVAIQRMLRSHKIYLVLRLKAGDTTMGYLCLGGHLTSHYSSRDMKVLDTIADSLAIAVQNAVSIHEVRELNDTLQQRINNATSELRRNNKQLQRLDEAKDEFISMASHQLRTPLTSIKGYLSMLIEGDIGSITKEQKHILNEAFISSERMVRLIGDFLNVSRLQTGKFVIEKRPVDLAQLIARELEALEANAAARNITFVYKQPKDIPLLDLDENKIEQVIMNFADNAIYYSKDDATVTVVLEKHADYVEFTVTDKGIGVPQEEQPQLFNKFFRATNARRVRPDGTGVGLFLAKKVILEHNGTIVFSSKEGKGSTFGFRLGLPK